MSVAVQSTTAERVPITVTPVDANGNAAPVEGDLTFEILSGAATVQYQPEIQQLVFNVVSEDVAGASQIRFTADADMGTGVAAISEIIDYAYSSPQAASLGVSVGEPIPKDTTGVPTPKGGAPKRR
jgi:hypothetical protein